VQLPRPYRLIQTYTLLFRSRSLENFATRRKSRTTKAASLRTDSYRYDSGATSEVTEARSIGVKRCRDKLQQQQQQQQQWRTRTRCVCIAVRKARNVLAQDWFLTSLQCRPHA